MVLTEEQKERIRKNRERALQIQKRRREEIKKNERSEKISDQSAEEKEKPVKKQRTSTVKENEEFRLEAPLEDFEEEASEWVTKTEAMTVYCLPEGTMAVCSYEEKENPRNPKFKPMKLYKRSEIRYRAHKRHGGLDGLIEERNKRRQRKLEREMEEAREIFN